MLLQDIMYTNMYPKEGRLEDRNSSIRDALESALRLIYGDPIAKSLLEKSALTETQTETLLIHLLADSIASEHVKYEDKASFRRKSSISKGAFNRSLKQAQTNVISSIYTIILLGYLGMLDSPALQPYIEVSNQLEEYRDFINQEHQAVDTKIADLIKDLLKTIEMKILELAKPHKLSNPA